MWTNEDRLIYTATVQGFPRHYDPDAVRRKLALGTRGNLNKLIEAANKGRDIHDEAGQLVQPAAPEGSAEHLAALDAMGQLAAAAVLAFDLLPFDPETGGGVMEGEAHKLLAEFLRWLHAKKLSGAISSS